jgi:tRNA(Ile)-lysidine synthase
MVDVKAKVKEYITAHRLFEAGEHVLVALSGGADSAALVTLLAELSGELSVTVYAAHLHHGIRGEEADRDQTYCAGLCERLGVPFVTERVDVPTLAKERKMSVEACARELRYGFLHRAAAKLGCTKICTAHHADDNIETVLLHMIRGCGLSGLTGIQPIRDGIVRPLLALRKVELVAYLSEKGISYVHDSTNDCDDYTRNYIRHNLIPGIYKLNESADKAFLRMCDSLTEDSGFIYSVASQVSENATLEELRTLAAPVLKRYITLRYEALMGQGRRPDSLSLSVICDAVKNYEGAKKYAICGGVTAFVNASGIQLEKNANNTVSAYCVPLTFGQTYIPETGYTVLVTDDKKVADEWKNVYKLSTPWIVCFDKITKDGFLTLAARNGKEGDGYTFGKLQRSVSRQLIRYKIPTQQRDGLPRICVGEELIGVWGLPASDSVRAVGGGKNIYIFCLRK